jgi:hypothetical protein
MDYFGTIAEREYKLTLIGGTIRKIAEDYYKNKAELQKLEEQYTTYWDLYKALSPIGGNAEAERVYRKLSTARTLNEQLPEAFKAEFSKRALQDFSMEGVASAMVPYLAIVSIARQMEGTKLAEQIEAELHKLWEEKAGKIAPN